MSPAKEDATAICASSIANVALGSFEAGIAAGEHAVAVPRRAPFLVGVLGWTLAAAGRNDEARGMLDELRTRPAGSPPAVSGATVSPTMNDPSRIFCVVCLLLWTTHGLAHTGSYLQDLVAVAPQAAKVEYEDDRIRVVRLRLPPGGSLPMHDRPARVVIPLTANDARLSRADGTTSVTRTDPYRAAWSEPTRRAVTNLAATPLENIVVELKAATAPAKAAQAPADPPPEYLKEPRHRWLFENQYVRVYDVRIPRGDTTEFHRHAYDTVYVRPSGGRVATQLLGEPWRAAIDVAAGSVVFDADSKKPFTHRVRNDGTAEYHAMAIQLLPR